MLRGVVLAGGGARGSYHIGAWQALMELGFIPDIVTGTSVGAMNASLMALDRIEDARAMWLSITRQDVINMPKTILSKDLFEFVKRVTAERGMDLSPLEDMIVHFLDEDELRKSKCRYGLVTVNLNTLTPLELTLEEIPQGRLIDYIIASGACFPLVKLREIDGQRFIDGGYYDNIPTNLAAKMGATDIVEINLDGLGNLRALSRKYKGIHITQVKCYHDLGTILSFDPELAKRNIELGYLDTYKAFNRLDGVAFAFKPLELKRLYSAFGRKLLHLCSDVLRQHPTIFLTSSIFLKFDRSRIKNNSDRFLAALEMAMLAIDASITHIYTFDEVISLLQQAPLSGIRKSYISLLDDSFTSKITAPMAAADLGGLFLSLIKYIL